MKQPFVKSLTYILVSITLLVTFGLFQASAQGKIVGYIPTGYTTSYVDFSKITHLNIAFENPNDAGDLSYHSGNDAFVTAAHNNNVKVLISICGGGASNDPAVQQRYFNLISPANRSAFISKLVAYVNAHNLDGIDLDLEGPAINSDYSDFVLALRNAMPADKLVTAALSHENGGDRVSSQAIQAMDFLNIMAYDMGWGQAVHHSTYEYAVTCANWWMANKGLPASKVLLGVPFYGYTNTTGAGGISFASILSTYGEAAAQQDVWVARRKTIYYNGIPTIRKKTQLALDQNYGGIMIWQLAQDATGTNSLLYNIHQVMNNTGCTLPSQPGVISGNITVAPGSSQTYSIAAVSGATSYTWTLPSGWSGTSSSTSINVTVGNVGGSITVSATNGCGTGPSSSLVVSVNTCTLPAQPGAISGSTTVATGTNQTYSIAPVSGATSYVWTLPSEWTGSSTATSISATVGNAGGTITVSATNSCGTGPIRSLEVSVSSFSNNRALNRPVTVSSVQSGNNFVGSNAVDGNTSTVWSSDLSDPQSIIVDLGGNYNVKRVSITWGASYATNYRVQASSDGMNWSDVKVIAGNQVLVNNHTGLNGNGRYVAIICTAGVTSGAGYSVAEFEVYGNSTGGRMSGDQLSGVQEALDSEFLETYPNPVSNILKIKDALNFKGGHLKIVNTSGGQFVSEPMHYHEIDVSHLPPGFYILRLSKDQRVATKKFIKQ